MLTAISALNESSNSETSSDESNYDQDFQEEDYVAAHNSALALYGNGNLTSAEKSFRKLLNSDYFKQCGYDGKRPQPVAKKLQFNTLRYLGIILGNNDSYEEALDYLQRAINIDQTDVTLYFKFAYFAAKFKKFHLARSALEESLYNQQHNAEEPLLKHDASGGESEDENKPTAAPIRHWPTLDLLITMTYKLGDFMACLSYINIALRENPDFEKGHKLKKRIYDECPYIDPNPNNWNKEPDFSRIKFNEDPKPKDAEKEPSKLLISQWNLKTLAMSLFERYEICGETELLLEPCHVEYKEQPLDEKTIDKENVKNVVEPIFKQLSNVEDEDEVVILGSDDDIVILDDESDDNDIIIDEAEEEENIELSIRKVLDSIIGDVVHCAVEREEEHSCDVVSPIISEIVNSVAEVSTKAFIQRMLINMIDSSVTENSSFVSNLTSASKRKAGVSQFLNEVPSDLIEKRRSTRAKGSTGGTIGDRSIATSCENTLSSPRCEEVTAKQLLQGYFPSSLLNVDYAKSMDQSVSPEKKALETTHPSNNHISLTADDKQKNQKWLSTEEEKEFVEKFINKFCSTSRWNFLTQLEEFLAIVAENLKTRMWPKELCDIYLKCYVKWRSHTQFPDELAPQVPHRFIPVVIIANEIALQTKFNENSRTEEESNNSLNDCEDEFEVDIHFEEDLQHLIFNLFRVEPSEGARILSLQLNDFKIRDKKRQAIVVGDRLKAFLANNAIESVDVIHSPVPNYEVFTSKLIHLYVEKLEQKRLFSQICDLYDKREYALVRQILDSNLPRRATRKENLNIETRLFHLKMMIDTLWNLDEYKECIGWIEIGLHETKQQMQSEGNTNVSLELTAKQYIDLLKSLDCCLCMFDKDNDFAGVEEPFRARLANNLLDLCLEQVEGKEQILNGNQSTLPWVLLYKLISFTEQQLECSIIESPPGSVSFLCSAHDYLGQLSMCTKDEGRLLLVQADAIVSTLFKGVKERALADQLRKNLDQAMYCLYAHPSKKSKLKHLVDHSVSNIALRWERCMSPYQYLRPEKLPEYDDFKSNSILAETVLFFKRIVALIPDQFNLQGRNKSVKEYLTSGSDTNFPKFSKIPQKDRPLLDVLYLLADYYFKNNEFTTALEYYRYDLCFNQDRVDSWFPLALSLVNVLEQKINETYKDPSSGKIVELTQEIINRILVDSDVIVKCYERCHVLSPKNSMICIESANFAYTMHSFCKRQLNVLENPEDQLKSILKDRVPNYLKYASEHYDKALKLMEAQDEPDEMWLLHFMKGKIFEKLNLTIQECLSEYEKSLDKLLEQNATLPKKISYNSPAELSLELLEVYYRIHATILKQEFLSVPPSSTVLRYIGDLLNKMSCSRIFSGVNVTSTDTKSKEDKAQSSETDSSEPPAKAARLEDSTQTATWDQISSKCTDALEAIIRRFPQHFKSVHLYSRYHLNTSTSKRDIKKAQKYLWGQINSGSKNSIFSIALFGERKSNNLFNGIWRMPISEIDRAGSFSSHINKCMITLLDLAIEMKEQNILLEVALQLRRPPDVNQKYLYEKQRKSIALKAYNLLKKVLKSKIDEHIKYDSSLETRLEFLFELYQTYSKLRRLWPSKDESVVSLLVDLFKSMGGNGTSEEVLNFCIKITSMAKKGMDTPQSLASIVKGNPIEFLRKEAQSSVQPELNKGSPVSIASHSTQGSGSKVSQLAAESTLPSARAAATMEYLNAASSYYSNELAKMTAYLQSASGYASAAEAQALLSAYASYGLLESVSQQTKSSFAPSNKPKDVAKTSTSTAQRSLVSTVDLSSSNAPSQKKSNPISQKPCSSSGVTISRITQSQQARNTTSTLKGMQTFSHKPKGNNLSGQSNSNSSNKYTSYNLNSSKQTSKKITNQDGGSKSIQSSSGIQHGGKQGPASIHTQQKTISSALASQMKVSKGLPKPNTISSAGDVRKEAFIKSKGISKQKISNIGNTKNDPLSKAKLAANNPKSLVPKQLALKSTNMTLLQQKSKPKNTSTANTIMQSKQKPLQSLSKPSAQNQKLPTAGPSTTNTQVIDDDDVICID